MPNRIKLNPRHQKIYSIVCEIPKGCVSTYGDIARFAGYPRCARLVGVALRSAPDDLNIPWHRVINAQGKISFSKGSDKAQIQQQRLEEESVVFMSGVVNLRQYGWAGNIDKDLWQM
ncbi:MAG: cysteine methyltransferase [Cycloclasticus sp.]|nr:MAG: cysteine methyltransferase [Cycloclasticus sp.]